MRITRLTGAKARSIPKFLRRNYLADPKVRSVVEEILADVEKRGDLALRDWTKKFGGPALSKAKLRVTSQEIESALHDLPAKVRKAILASRANVDAFARKSLRKTWFTKNRQGGVAGERFDPFQRVGLYIPGGTAPLVSSAIMTTTLARAAGVPEIVTVTPCAPDGTVNSSLVAALSLCGATEIYRIGGAQAVAALAMGTKTIAPVQKIYGPGSVWVVEAKRQLFGRVAVDLLPGPSEVLVIADETARSSWIAADLLAQAEHGHGSAAILLTTSEEILRQVKAEIKRQQKLSSRKNELGKALRNTTLILVESLAQAARIANEYAAEHVSIVTREPGNVSASLTTSGAVFLGGMSPVAVGDFLAGPSHELPTGGAGKSFSGLTVDQFQRRTSVVRYNREALEKAEPLIRVFSEIEGLDAHGRSVSIRLGEA